MKSYDELKAEMETIQQQMAEAKKNERANALKEVKRLCKEFGFTAGMLKVEKLNSCNVLLFKNHSNCPPKVLA